MFSRDGFRKSLTTSATKPEALFCCKDSYKAYHAFKLSILIEVFKIQIFLTIFFNIKYLQQKEWHLYHTNATDTFEVTIV